jgi:hypothetical protein
VLHGVRVQVSPSAPYFLISVASGNLLREVLEN